jgi:hypothetical protein
MSFFEPPLSRPEPAAERSPDWIGPPNNVFGAVLPLALLVAHSDKAAVRIESATVYPSGVQFALDLRWKSSAWRLLSRGDPWEYRPSDTGELPEELFRAGFQFADGSKVTTLRNGLPRGLGEALDWAAQKPDGPVLVRRGRGGTGLRWVQDVWLWPLPPAGPLAFVCEWPALGVDLTGAHIDSTLFHQAAGRSESLWENG